MLRPASHIRYHIAAILLRIGKFFDIKKGQPFVWQCHDCHKGVVIPGIYINIHGETIKIDPKSLDPNTEVMRF